jgi:hypothetical protein
MVAYVDRSLEFKACHAPTKRKVKGTAAVLQACRGLADLDLIEGVRWEDALRRKGKCWVTIDQFQLGYGCNAIESWMMGQPVVAGATDRRTILAIRGLAATGGGPGETPFVEAVETPESIRKAVERLKNDQDYYDKMRAAGADYALRYHSMQAVAGVALGYYHEAIEAFYSRGAVYSPPTIISSPRRARGKAAKIASANSVEVEYLGKSAGWTPFEVNGRKYRFSSMQPIQAVDPRDADALLAILGEPIRERGKRGKRPGLPLFRRA